MFCIKTILAFVVFVAGILFVGPKLRRWANKRGKIWFNNFNKQYLKDCKELFRPTQEKIFKCLNQMPERPLKVVEIGTGAGANFDFLPKNTEIVCIEPNEYAEKDLLIKAAQYPDIKVTFKIGVAEDLSSLADESVDAVICTHVLCSVTDLSQSLKEVLRVLKKGGKFMFMEHIEDVSGSRIHFLQHLLKVPWHFALQGCNLTRTTNISIQNAGFSNIDMMDIFKLDFKKTLFKLVGRQCAGVATK